MRRGPRDDAAGPRRGRVVRAAARREGRHRGVPPRPHGSARRDRRGSPAEPRRRRHRLALRRLPSVLRPRRRERRRPPRLRARLRPPRLRRRDAVVLDRGLRGRRAAAASRPASSSSGTSRSPTATSRSIGTRSSSRPTWRTKPPGAIAGIRSAGATCSCTTLPRSRRLCRPRRLERAGPPDLASPCRCRSARASPTAVPEGVAAPGSGNARSRALRRARPDRSRARRARRRGPRDANGRSSRSSTTSPSARRSFWRRRAAWPSDSSRRPGRSSRARSRRGCRPRERCGTGSPTRALLGAPPSSPEERAILERLASGEAARVADLPGEGASAARSPAARSRRRAASGPSPASKLRAPRVELAWAPVARLAPTSARRRLGRSREGREVLDYLEALGRPATTAEIRLATGAGAALLRTLGGQGPASLLRAGAAGRAAAVPPVRRLAAFVPTPAQAAALEAITSAIRERRYFPALLQGVTGSGKTEVYLRAIRDRARGRPRRDLARPRDRPDARLRPGAAPPVSGPRRRAPLGPLGARARRGLGPRALGRGARRDRPALGGVRAGRRPGPLHRGRGARRLLQAARVAALRRPRGRGAPREGERGRPRLRLGDALGGGVPRGRRRARGPADPPGANRLAAASGGPDRGSAARDARFPTRRACRCSRVRWSERLREVFARGEQAILLQPRRGFAPFLLCRDCGHDFRCSRCSVARTVHERGRRLVCHYCGERVPRPARCPECGGGLLEAIGAGTERVAERFAELFPGVPSVVLDRDSARRRGAAAVRRGLSVGPGRVPDRNADGGEGPRLPERHGRRRPLGRHAAALSGFPLRREDLPAPRPGRGPGRPRRDARDRARPDVSSRASGDHARRAPRRRGVRSGRSSTFRRTFFYPPFCELAAILVSSPRPRTGRGRGRGDRARRFGPPERRRVGSCASRARRPPRSSGSRGAGASRSSCGPATAARVLAALEAAVPERPPAGVQIAVDVDPQDLM